MGKKMFNKNKTGVMPKKVLAAKRAKAQNRSFEREDNDEFDDEVDTFLKGKDKVSFSRHEEDEEDTVEPVMDLEIPDSDEENQDEVDEDEEDDDEDDFKTKMMLKRFGAVKDDDDEDDIDDQDIDAMYDQKWGKGKKSYYDADVKSDNKQKLTNKIDFDAQDAEDAEEEEAKRLQKKKAALLSASDFDDDLQETLEQKVKSKTTTPKKTSTEQKMIQNVRKDLESINFDLTDDSTVVESVRKDLTKLSKEEKLELIMNDSPELLTLLEELKESISEISEKLDPVLSKVKSGDMPTGKGVSYLEVKYHLLLTYCTNITFYLLMKANGKSVKDHPVIDQLVRIRTILERLKPLDKKLSYQINKLLQLAATGSIHVDGKDPRSFRPNPEALEHDEDEEDQLEAPVEKKGVYKIPKLQEMHFEEKTATTQRRKEERERKRAESSQMMKFIRQEYGDEPEEEPNIGADKRNVDPEMKRRAEYEEDMYIRLALTKEDKKRLNRKEREVDELQSLADFGDIAAVTKPQVDPNAILTKKTIKDVIHKIKKDRNEDDSNKKRKGVHFGMEAEDDFNDFGFEELEDDFAESGKNKKNKKQKVKEQPQPQEDTFDYDEEDENTHNPGEKRGINYAIEKNRGLTRHRNRETKTPRTRLRNKYDKAVSKRSGQVRRMADKSKPYGGEATGIKSNLVRSVKLKF